MYVIPSDFGRLCIWTSIYVFMSRKLLYICVYKLRLEA